jgi:hypothetical protein
MAASSGDVLYLLEVLQIRGCSSLTRSVLALLVLVWVESAVVMAGILILSVSLGLRFVTRWIRCGHEIVIGWL